MSSASSGRYQSRLFNFVRKQSRRFTQQRDRAFRHLQLSASWVAAVGLYPLLLIFQSTRSAAKQMHQAVQQNFPQLPAPDLNVQPQTPPTVDTPIQQVLLLVEALSSEEVISTPPPAKPKTLKNILAFLVSNALTRFATLERFKSGDRKQQGELGKLGEPRSLRAKEQRRILPTTYHLRLSSGRSLPPTIPPLTTPGPIIQGIATQLSSRALVLVTAQNEILDILTAQQQQTLQQQMIAAIADYWRYQRLACSVRSSEVKVLGNEFPTEDTRSILSPQSSLVRKPRITDPLLAFLDRTIAELESNHWEPVSAVAIDLSQRSRQFIQQLQTQFNFALSRGKSLAIAPDVGSAYTTRMQTLIRAAIDYFFGHRGRQHLGQNMPKSAPSQKRLSQNYSSHNAIKTPALPIKPSLKSTNLSSLAGKQLTGRRWAAKLSSAKLASAQLPSCPQLVEPNIEDPWLTLSDLFGEEVATGETATDSQPKQSKSRTISSGTKKTNLALPTTQAEGFFLQNLVNSWQKLWTLLKPESGIVKRQKIAKGKLIGTSSKQAPPVFKSPQQVKAGEISTQTGSQSSQLEPAPDWIETNATVMGYVKHPLEQLLVWLDQAMLWLEEVLIKLWRWLRNSLY